MFSHYGYLKCLWDVIIIVATIYVAIIVPYNAAFYGTSHDVDNVTLRVEDHFYCPQGIYFSISFLRAALKTIFIELFSAVSKTKNILHFLEKILDLFRWKCTR